MPVALSLVVTIKNVSRLCQMSWRRQNPTENHWSRAIAVVQATVETSVREVSPKEKKKREGWLLFHPLRQENI